jgi:multiple antibiotic resistance protein
MIFPPDKSKYAPSIEREPFIVPLAVPLVAGPAVLSSVMLYARQELNNQLVMGAVVLAWIISTLVLLSSSLLKKWLGERILIATERLMGLLLTILAVQMLLNGLRYFISH